MNHQHRDNVNTKHIATTRTARFYLLGEHPKNVQNVWFVLHGYAQAALDFISSFEPLNTKDTLIIAPEGLHRFYLKRHTGKVVASWMTRDDREMDIQDNMKYLDSVFAETLRSLNHDKVSFNLLGFSQGVSTALRWAAHSGISFERVICWAGSIPPVPEFENIAPALVTTRLMLVFGDKDPFFNDEAKQAINDQLRNHKLDAATLEFDGVHEIDATVLKRINEK